MHTMRDDIELDKLRQPFSGLRLNDRVKRMIVEFAEHELKWPHAKAIKAAGRIIHETEDRMPKPRKLPGL